MFKITILCENTVGSSRGILGEHGFAALIETATSAYLYDTGQGATILHNAKILRKDLKKVETIFLSHGHFDHTGGLLPVVRAQKGVKVRAHPDLFSKRFARVRKNGDAKLQSIGIPSSKRSLARLGASFSYNRTITEVGRNIYLTGEIPRRTAFEKKDRRLLIKKEGKLVQDPLRDDQALVIKTRRGLVIVLGCAHASLINTLQFIQEHFSHKRMHTVLGGTHLGFLEGRQLGKTIKSLSMFGMKKIGVSHCTGLVASMKLMQEFGDNFFLANAGSVIEV